VAVNEADTIITMLSDGAATTAVLSDVIDAGVLTSGTTWIEMSSVKPGEARAQAKSLAEHGVAHLDAPVSGGTKGAEAGTLAIMVGGDATAFEASADVFAPLGRAVHVGPSGSGQLAKLANQAIVAVTIGAVAEAMLLLERGGADPAAVRDALKGGFADSTILQQHGRRMTERDFVPGGLSKFQLKDLENVLAEATAYDLNLPMTRDVRDRFAHFCEAMQGADLDHSGLFLELLARNGENT
jgi:2-hydroxy-3-oxopropionate reductase